MGRSTLTLETARATLGLHGPCDAEGLTRAFRAAVKAARPDHPGGDEARFRRVIEAYRLIQALGGVMPALAAPVAAPPPWRPLAMIDVGTALSGGPVLVSAGRGRRLRAQAPAGLRTGDHLRLRGAGEDGADLFVAIRIRSEQGLRIAGDDLYMDWRVEPRLLGDGGRVEIQTHAGARSAWLAGGGTQPPRLRLKGLGLPARGGRPQGHLFVDLIPGEDTPSAAAHLLRRFNAVWTPERLAA